MGLCLLSMAKNYEVETSPGRPLTETSPYILDKLARNGIIKQ